METPFTIRGALKESRGIISRDFWNVVRQFAALIALFILLFMLGGNNLLVSMLIKAMAVFTLSIYALGYAKQGSFSFAEFGKALSFQGFAYFFLAFLVSGIFMALGFIALIIPGIILAVRFSFVRFIASEREIGPLKACEESARLTSGNRWKLFGFFIVMGLINILGAICLFVGLFYTIPLTTIASALVYRKLYDAKDFVPEIVEVIETEEGVIEVSAEVV